MPVKRNSSDLRQLKIIKDQITPHVNCFHEISGNTKEMVEDRSCERAVRDRDACKRLVYVTEFGVEE
jgi:hypothetical protein